MLEYAFFQHALLGGLLASVLCAVVGTYVVTRRMVIIGGGMAHASLGGVGLGAWLGFSPLIGAAGFALATGFFVQHTSLHRRVTEDSAIAMLWTLGMALGILFSSLTPGFMTDLPAYLFGNILSISSTDLWFLTALTVIATGIYVVLRESIISVACDRDFAKTQGLPVTLIEGIMTVLTALSIVACLQMVGIVMVISLLSVPQMTAALTAHTYDGIVRLSALTAFAGCVGGLTFSAAADVPSGAAIIIVQILIYLLARTIKHLVCQFNNR